MEFADPVELPFKALRDEPPAYLAVSGSGGDVYVDWGSGHLLRILPADEAGLTALGFILGNTTLVWGDSTGRVEAGFPVRLEELESDGIPGLERSPEATTQLVATKVLARGGSAALAETLRGERMVQRVVRVPGAPDRFFDLHAAPLRTGGELPGGAVVVLSDLTELRRLATIRRDFVSNVSHELKTPVTVIRGLVETLAEDPAIEAATRQRFLGKIRNQAERLSNLVTDLMSLSRLESEQLQPELGTIDVREPVIQSVRGLQPVSEAKELLIETELADAPLLVHGEEETMERAVTNLLDNAIKYSPEGGRIAVRAQAREGRVVIEVEDEGPGIEPRHRERIFERFYRADAVRSRALGGTGLGLAIVKHTALALGGDVSLDSTPGKGSTFRIRLPLAQTAETADPGEPGP